MIKVSVVGAKGRMGSHVVEAVNNAVADKANLILLAANDPKAISTAVLAGGEARTRQRLGRACIRHG